MAKRLHRLSARTVATATKPGRHADGGNLYLVVAKGGSKHWAFLYEYRGKQREIGLGGITRVSLAQARRKATEYRGSLDRDVDPLEARKATSAPGVPSFGECADALIKSKRSGWRSSIHAEQWVSTLRTYCGPIRNLPVDQIDTPAVLSVLTPIWSTVPETAVRLRGRIEVVLNYAKAHKFRDGPNPATWRGHLELILPRRPKLARPHFAALPYPDVPKFVAQLRGQGGVASLCVEFIILTASRSTEAREATWNEIDLETAVWSILPERMKAGVGHRVPLASRTLRILEIMRRHGEAGFIFKGRQPPRPISSSGVALILPPGVTLHGFRSSFRDWCGEETSFPREIAEQALAHTVGGAVERSYRRGDALEKRRQLMEAWAAYCDGTAAGNVIAIGGGRK